MRAVDQAMRAAVDHQIFPGAQLIVSKGNAVLLHRAYGTTDIYSGVPVSRSTLFDLASLTKPLATSLAAMLLVQQGRLGLNQRLGQLLSGFAGTSKAGIPVHQLLTHTAGFPDYRPYYLTLRHLPAVRRAAELRNLMLAEPLISAPGETMVYSDIGFMVLQWVLETVSGRPLHQFVETEIYGPLKITPLFFPGLDLPLSSGTVAATEFCPWRKQILRGRVHDENAHVLGGVAGHAGLFGTAGAVHALLANLLKTYHGLSDSGIFQTEPVRRFFRKNRRSGRALGFDMPSATASSSGHLFSPNATVGHLGFTGTSFWMDLNQQVIVVLLTNRVHPSRANEEIRAFRPRIHDLVMRDCA